MENKNLIKNILIPTKISRITDSINKITSGNNTTLNLNSNNTYYQSSTDLYEESLNENIPTKKTNLSSSVNNIVQGNNYTNLVLSNGDRLFYTNNHFQNNTFINSDTLIPSKIDNFESESTIETITSTKESRLFLTNQNQLYLSGSFFGQLSYGNHVSFPKLLSTFSINFVHNTDLFDPTTLTDISLNYFHPIYPTDVLTYEYPVTLNEDKNIILEAMAKWESVITSVPFYFGSNEYNNKLPVRIVFRTNFNSGSLASTGIISFKKKTLANTFGEKLPSEAKISLNYNKWQEYKHSVKSDGKTRAYYLILHELGHALGIGSVWINVTNTNSDTSAYNYDSSSNSYFYNGSNGNREYRNVLGVTNTNYQIPLEDSGGYGTEIVHPEENENRIKDGLTHFGLDHELMTGYVESDDRPEVLSRISIGMLEDLGYQVNYENADDYYLFLISFNSNGYLQIKGSDNGSSELRTIYYNVNNNTNEDYLPVKKNLSAYYHILGGLNLDVSFNQDNQLLISNKLTYQFLYDEPNRTYGLSQEWSIFDNSFFSSEDIGNNLIEEKFGGLTENEIKSRLTFAFNEVLEEINLVSKITNNRYNITKNDINNIRRIDGFQSEFDKRIRLKKTISTILSLNNLERNIELVLEKESLPFNINLTRNQVKVIPSQSTINLTDLQNNNQAFYSPLENIEDTITINTINFSLTITNIGNSYLVREGDYYDVMYDGDEKIFDGLYYQIGSGSGEPVDGSENNLGCSIALTKNGRNLVVGDGNSQEVSIYKYNQDWISYQNGNITNSNRFGRYLDCNDAGNIIIVGDPDINNYSGTFYLYQQTSIDNSGISYQVKSDGVIQGNQNDGFGVVGTNSEGTEIVVGSLLNGDGYIKSYQVNGLPKEPHHVYETGYLDLLDYSNYLDKTNALIDFRFELQNYLITYNTIYDISQNNYLQVNNLTDYVPTLSETNIDTSSNFKYAKIHMNNIIDYTEFDFKNYNHFMIGHNENVVIMNQETELLNLTYDGSNNLFYDSSQNSYNIDHLFVIDIDTSGGTITKKFRIVGFGSGSFFGDPHIITLTGQRYYFNYLGNFRLLRYQDEDNLIIINGLSQRGTQRWKKKQYIKKLFIKHNDKEILINLGFRGEKCEVLENNGFEYHERDLPMHPNHKIHCFNRYCLKEFNNWDEAKKHLKEVRNKHTVKKPVRNEIVIIIPELLRIECSNINSYNFQPCRLIVTPLPKLNKLKTTGTIVDPKYSNNPQIDDIKEIKKIEYNFDFIPKYEIASKLVHLESDL